MKNTIERIKWGLKTEEERLKIKEEEKKRKGKRLNLGCGNKKRKGWVNADIDPECKPDIIVDITKPLPFKDMEFDEIILDNVMEHLPMKMTILAEELRRITKENGTIKIIAPNCFYWKSRIKYLFGKFEAGEGYYYEHCWILKPSIVKRILEISGIQCNKVNNLLDKEIRITGRRRI